MSRTPDRPYRLTELRHNELILVPFRHATRLAAWGPWGALRQIAERIVRPVAMPDAHPGALDGLLPVCRMGLPVAQHPADTSPVCASSTGGRVRMLGPVDIEETVHALFLDLCHLETGSSTTVPLSLDKDRVKDSLASTRTRSSSAVFAPTPASIWCAVRPGALIADHQHRVWP
jgi:hypothetical protein